MAGVVVACKDKAAGAVADDLGDAAIPDVERPGTLDIEADHDVAEGADDPTVRDCHGGAFHGTELTKGCLQAIVKRVSALFAWERRPPSGAVRREDLGKALPEFRTTQPARLADVVLHECRHVDDAVAKRPGDRFRGIRGSPQRARYNAIDFQGSNVPGGRARLEHAGWAQAEVHPALDDAAGVAFGFPVADEDEAHG